MKMLSSSFSTGPAFQHHFLLFTSGHQQHQHLLFSSGSPSTSALHRQHHRSPPLLHLLWSVSSLRCCCICCCHPCCCFLLPPAAPETATGHQKLHLPLLRCCPLCAVSSALLFHGFLARSASFHAWLVNQPLSLQLIQYLLDPSFWILLILC